MKLKEVLENQIKMLEAMQQNSLVGGPGDNSIVELSKQIQSLAETLSQSRFEMMSD